MRTPLIAAGLAAWLTIALGQAAGLSGGRVSVGEREPSQRGQDDRQLASLGLPGFNWPWGELFYERTYNTSLDVYNGCPDPETVTTLISSSLQPYLSMQRTVTVPGRSRVDIDVTITTPTAPVVGPPPPGAPPSPLGVFTEVKGTVAIRRGSTDFRCRGDNKIYEVYGHIHVNPFPPDPTEGEPCIAYWLTGRFPAGAVLDCTDEFRRLAHHYVEAALKPYVDKAPGAWAWLPTSQQIDTMGAQALLDMKNRAEEQRLTGVAIGGGG